jgi:hypothetical protein
MNTKPAVITSDALRPFFIRGFIAFAPLCVSLLRVAGPASTRGAEGERLVTDENRNRNVRYGRWTVTGEAIVL